MEGVEWYTYPIGDAGGIAIEAAFDGRRQRIFLSGLALRTRHCPAALAGHAVEQLTLIIRADRQRRAKRRAYSELH